LRNPSISNGSNDCSWCYVIVYGVLGWGISTTFLITLIQTYICGSPFIEQISIALVIYPISRLAFGLIMWMVASNYYNKLKLIKVSYINTLLGGQKKFTVFVPQYLSKPFFVS
jgi:hypothetical protein